VTQIWAEQALTPEGWQNHVTVTIADSGAITGVRADTPPAGTRVGCLLPAPVNAHSHAFQRAMAGLTEARGPDGADSFWTWRKLMFRFLDQLDPDQVQAIAAFVQMEMLEAGYATNVEFHYLHHQPDGHPYPFLGEMASRIGAAADQSGIGLTLLPTFYQHGGCDQRPLGRGQIRFGNDLDGFAALHDASHHAMASGPADWQMGVALHSLRAVARADIPFASGLGGGGPIHMHLAEQIAEVEEVEAEWGQRPVEWALDHLDLDARWSLIHCTQMTRTETAALARSGATAVLCPITESNLGDGIFDCVHWMQNDGRLAIGSDSNIRIALAEELRVLEYSQRLRDRSRAALATPTHSTGRRLFDAMLAGGATAAGRKTGALRSGDWADLLALDLIAPDLAGLSGDTILDSYVFAGGDGLVSDVWSAGRHMVRAGRHVERDRITTAYMRAINDLRAAL
jgi:formimidoylglutamate deiminase